MICFIIIESIIGYLLGINGYWLPWSIDVTFTCMIFYYFGYILKKYDLLNKIISNNLIIIVLLILWIIGIKYFCIELALRNYPYYLCSFITAICGTLVIFKLSLLIEKYLKIIPSSLSWCGKNTLYILFYHYIARSLFHFNFYLYNTAITHLIIILIYFAFSILLTYITIIIIRFIKKEYKLS